jgi:hypothetical protein
MRNDFEVYTFSDEVFYAEEEKSNQETAQKLATTLGQVYLLGSSI